MTAAKARVGSHSSVVEEQLAEAVSRIRAYDILVGALLLASWTAAYALMMIIVDRLVVLPEWVRQCGWGAFLLVAAGIAWRKLIKPIRLPINPLYAAAQVEKTIDNPKNLLTAYVEVTERGETPPAVKAALSARAAQLARHADVNQAVDPRGLLYLGLLLGLLLVALASLFFWWRATQFTSLLQRTFLPFTSQPIATRTQITLIQPPEGNTAITQGQTFIVRVYLGGRIPSADSEERPRLLLRYSLEGDAYEEIPLQPAENPRDWQGRVPDYLIQTGFWYKVAAGDAETPEYRVTVRTLPLFTDFEVRYEYPDYMNRPADRASGPYLRTYRGTRVSLTARTNREPLDGKLLFEIPQLETVPGQRVNGLSDALQFNFIARESTRYRLRMNTSLGETNIDSPWFLLTIDPDLPPTVSFTRPSEADTVLPANGTLVVDGQVGDDFGIDRVRLRFRYQDKEFLPVPYLAGRSFRRERDNTWPTYLTFKMSVDLAQLRTVDNKPFSPSEGMVLEYWAEAIDNCSEAPPVPDWDDQRGQVGRTEIRRLRLSTPLTPELQQQQQTQRQSRRQEEEKHDQEQQQRLETEDRTPPTAQQQSSSGQPQPNQPQPKDNQSRPAENQSQSPQPSQEGPVQSKEGQAQSKEGQASLKRARHSPKRVRRNLREVKTSRGNNRCNLVKPSNPNLRVSNPNLRLRKD
jgi:hypothetical protein